MLRRASLSPVVFVSIVLLASHDAAFVARYPHPFLKSDATMQSTFATLQRPKITKHVQTASHGFARFPTVRQEELASDQNRDENDGSDGTTSDDATNNADLTEASTGDNTDQDPNASEGSVGNRNNEAAAVDGGATFSDGNTASSDGDAAASDGNAAASDGDATTSEGDATTAKGDATTTEGDATTAEGDATTAEGDTTTAEGDATAAEGDATTAEGDATTAEGDTTTAEGDATSSEGESTSSGPDSETPTQKGNDEVNTGSSGEQVQEEKESATGDTTDEAGNATHPFDAFTLMQMDEVSSDSGFEQVIVFQNGSFVGPFANSPNTSSIDELADSDQEKWYTDSEYTDRIAFRFIYTPESKDYVISEPVVAVGQTRGMYPFVEDFTNDPSNGRGSFTILYQCQLGAPETSHITFKFQITAERSIETIWTKKCGSGRHEHLDFGFKAHDNSVELFNADGTYGTDEQRTLEVGPLETGTELIIGLVAPAQNQQFLDPYVSSDSDSVAVQLRGTISKGTLSIDEPTSFSILYECKSATTANIKFTVEIPPWENVTAEWRKDCGGSPAGALLIGTTGKSSYDVMQDGELASRYNVTNDTTLDEADGVVELIPPDVDTQRFDITNSDDTSNIHIQTITMTMSNPEVVTAVVSTPIIDTRSYIPSSGDVIQRQHMKSLSIHFLCKREGKSLVLVTLPTLRYKNVEFGFIKQCDEPRTYHHSGFLQTAGSLMAAFLFLGVVGAIASCIYLKRRQGAKYTAVPTSDGAIP